MRQDEKDDFEKSISEKGLNKNDFEISSENIYGEPDSNGIRIVQEKITVKKGQIEKTYSGSTWNVDFDKDLRNGFFDTP